MWRLCVLHSSNPCHPGIKTAHLNKAISLEQSALKLKQKLLHEDQQIITMLNK